VTSPTVGGPQRALIVDALSTVAGLSPSPVTPAPIVAGSAWPGWFETTWANACVKVSQFYVFVALPSGQEGASVDAGDQLVDEVAEVLWPVGHVLRVEPWQWPVEPGQQAVPVLRFTLEVM
jgi:hypothetical protein